MVNPQPRVLITIPVTRDWSLNGIFRDIEALECDPKETDILFYIDSNNPIIESKCLVYKQDSKYERVKVEVSGHPGASTIRISARRERITEVKEEIKKYVYQGVEYVMGIEDDSIFPPESLQRLLIPIMRPDVGFIQGVQVGRWGMKYVGAWKFDNILNPTNITSMPFLDTCGKNDKYLENIDAGGFYCYMTKAILYRGANYRWDNRGNGLGPDICFGLDLKKHNYKCLIDWGLIIPHNDYGKLIIPDDKCVQIRYNLSNDEWKKVK